MNLVSLHGSQAVTTSRVVAEHFGKQHKNVLRDIDALRGDCPKEFTELNFEPSSYIDPTGRQLPEYLLTRDGFALLAMGFTGKAAIAWKIAFLEAFNRLADSSVSDPLLRKADALRIASTVAPPELRAWANGCLNAAVFMLPETVRIVEQGLAEGVMPDWPTGRRRHPKNRITTQ